MTALSKFLVLLAIFLLASLGDAFLNHAWLNHLIQSFDASMSNPMNETSCVPSREPTNNRMNGQTTNSNTSYTFEAVHGVSHVHVKYIVTSQVTIRDGRDNEIQSMCPDLSLLPQPSNWQGPKQRSLEISARVLFATFRSNLSSGLICWVHSHTGCEPVTSTRGLCHGKKSEQAGCIASAQTRGYATVKKSERAGCIAFAQTRGLCHGKKSE
jgi:hypothetical protein